MVKLDARSVVLIRHYSTDTGISDFIIIMVCFGFVCLHSLVSDLKFVKGAVSI